MRIFYWPADSSGCGYYRCVLPGLALANLGHDVHVNPAMPDWVRVGGVDVIVGQRTCNVGASVVWQKLATIGHTKLVLELDDDLWHLEASNAYAVAAITEDYQRRLADNVKVADLVTVTTEPLAEVVSQWNRNVVVLPNMVPAWLLEQPVPAAGERLTIGWGGSPSHVRDFGEVAKPVKRVLQRHHGSAEFHCMGPDYTDRVRTPKTSTRHTGWFAGVEDYLRAVDFHVGVAPLLPCQFNDCKSDVKLLEYAALGIPAVVSDTGPYARAIAAGVPAVAAAGHKAWEHELDRLVRNTDERAALGHKAREWASTRVIGDNIHLWEEAYRCG